MMKRTAILLIGVLMVIGAAAQTASDALKSDNQTLRERYLLMKTKSQNYQDYKVIKENLLDSWWKIVTDSLQAKQAAIRQSKADASKLQAELNQSMETLKAKEGSMQDVVYASTHIKVLGIDFDKGFFAGLVGILILGLGIAIAALVYTLGVSRKNQKEKSDLAAAISAEYEEYKRKAMDKQTKLSRELQNERNKLQELGAL
jgi:biopolymer transport protein ExbB/TolQ